GKRGPTSRSGYTNADIDEWWKNRNEFSADPDAEYAIELDLDLATVVPHVSGPNEVKTMVSLPEMERKHVPIQKAYLLSCVNARFADLHDAAEVERAAGTAIRRAEKKKQPAGSVEIIAGFPPSVRGRVLFVDKDNLNTDGIYGSKHTYRDDMTPEEMAAVTFENYDPNFNTLYRSG